MSVTSIYMLVKWNKDEIWIYILSIWEKVKGNCSSNHFLHVRTCQKKNKTNFNIAPDNALFQQKSTDIFLFLHENIF